MSKVNRIKMPGQFLDHHIVQEAIQITFEIIVVFTIYIKHYQVDDIVSCESST